MGQGTWAEPEPDEKLVEMCARVAHEMNRAYCKSLGDDSQLSWEDAPLWQQVIARHGAKAKLINPSTTPAESHAGWLRAKEEDGWKYGPVKDPSKKEHPCFVPYELLPEAQKAKDFIFVAAVEQTKWLWGHLGGAVGQAP